VPKGDVGIIGASGTGIQEVSCLIAQSGRGVSHAIGTGGRDLKAEVGGITTLMAFDLLDADPATREIIVLSKPPAPEIAARVLERAARSPKPVTISFLGSRAGDHALPANVRFAHTLAEAAAPKQGGQESRYAAPPRAGRAVARGRLIRALYAGGTLASEAQFLIAAAGLPVASNVPIPGAIPHEHASAAGMHQVLDLGDDAFTRARPHPMIEPLIREAPLREAAADPAIAAILLDVVLGYGAHHDPAGHIAAVVASLPRMPVIIASVTGTDRDPQVRRSQIERLEAVGIKVAASNAAAVEAAIAAVA
jgi:succinyl-CoA synthetase alpha subunit